MTVFPPEDLAKDLKGLDFACDDIPVQRSLGLSWLLKSDAFTYQVSTESKPYTKRGVLSVVNSIYDPLGFVAPATFNLRIYSFILTAKLFWDTYIIRQEGFKSGICLLIAPVPVHCFSLTFMSMSVTGLIVS